MGYDTLNTVLYLRQALNTDFIKHLSKILIGFAQHLDSNETLIAITGSLPSYRNNSMHYLKVRVTANCVRVGKASWSKWYYGDAFRTFSIEDFRAAVELLSTLLGLPMHNAHITRLDIGLNLELEHPVGCYLGHLGELPRHKRQPFPHEGLRFSVLNRNLLFYDKVKEQRAKRQAIPATHKHMNLLRIELQLTRRVSSEFKVKQVTLGMLCDGEFYQECMCRLLKAYSSIKKLNDMVLDFNRIKTKRQLQLFALAFWVNYMGGELKCKQIFTNAMKTRYLKKHEAYHLIAAVNEACKSPLLTKPSPLISELDRKIAESVARLGPHNEN